MRARWPWLTGSMLVACNAVSGVRDLKLVDCVDCAEAGATIADAGSADTGRVTDTGTAPPADQRAPDVAVDTRPAGASYCGGITFNAPFDADLNSAAGQNPTTSDPVSLSPGRYSNAATLTTAAVFWDATVKPLHNKDVGTVALWMKPNFILKTTDMRGLYRPRTGQGAAANNAGPGITIEGLTVVMENQDGMQAKVTIAADQVAANWTPTGFMLFVGTWNRTGMPAGAPTLTLTLSSTVGSTTVTTTEPWTPGNEAKFIRVGSQTAQSQMLADDVTLWNRQLGAQEIKDLFVAPLGVTATCGM